jgi:hypothetical protein
MLVAVTPGAVAPPLPELLVLVLLAAALLVLLLLLLDDPHAATTRATATMTPTYASDLVPRKLIPLLLLHTVDPTGTARPSTRGI